MNGLVRECAVHICPSQTLAIRECGARTAALFRLWHLSLPLSVTCVKILGVGMQAPGFTRGLYDGDTTEFGVTQIAKGND